MTLELRFPDTAALEPTQIVRAEIDRQIGGLNQMQAFVPSRIFEDQDGNRVEPVRQRDEVRLVQTNQVGAVRQIEFAGIHKELVGDGSVTEVIVDSFERLMLQAEPFAGGEKLSGTDEEIVEQIIGRVADVQQGQTVTTTSDDVQYDFSHKSPARALRIVTESEGTELLYNPDKTVDYVQSLGNDRTDESVINPANQTAVGEVRIERKGRNERVSHLRVLGAGEGSAQLTAEATADWYTTAESNNENPQQSWKVVPNKEITTQQVLEDYAETLITELNEPAELKIEVTIPGSAIGGALTNERVGVGDEFRVTYETEGITEQKLRATSVTEVHEKGTVEFLTSFQSTEALAESTDSRLRQDTDRLNMSVTGDAVEVFRTAGQQSVTGNGDIEYKLDFSLPENVITIRDLVVRVFGKADADNSVPEQCDVRVNTTSVNTNFGNGNEFIKSVDISDKVDTGEINSVSLTAQEPGLVRMAVIGRLLIEL